MRPRRIRWGEWSTPRSIDVVSLGLKPYGPVLELQRALAAGRIEGRLTRDVLLLVEHPPVVTLGRSSKDAHLLASPGLLSARGVERFEVERGGDVTFHGPGQLVGYPILDLGDYRRDLHWYLRQVEEVLITALAAWGLQGTRRTGHTGVWTPVTACEASPSLQGPYDGLAGPARPSAARKIASIGVHAKQWVTWHGFALNVSTDLSYFDLMVPCGIAGVEMTSIERETGRAVTASDAIPRIVRAFSEVFGIASVVVDAATLPLSLGDP